MKRFFGLAVLLAIGFGVKQLGRFAPKLEVSDLQCTRPSRFEILISASVKNVGDTPLALQGNATLIFPADRRRPVTAAGPVTPKPLAPGATGRLEIRTEHPAHIPPPGIGTRDGGSDFGGGDCRLDDFLDEGSGERVKYKEPS
jgi:hypothetical protein